ncbi:MAG: hypothetical protein LC797_14080 [Chloroflexi bacterium]|nr:hypothetical protein [Chloroflexota bacterium]
MSEIPRLTLPLADGLALILLAGDGHLVEQCQRMVSFGGGGGGGAALASPGGILVLLVVIALVGLVFWVFNR